jgi:penicillin amidase
MGNAQHAVWDDTRTPAHETRPDVLRAAFVKAVDGLKAQLGDDPKTWTWGRVHVMRPMHPFGSKSALDSLVNLEPTPAAGELDSVWKSHFDMGAEKTPFKPVAGPVYRLVADLGDLNHAEWVIDTGTSGWPKSPHYGDQYQAWRKGELVPMRYQLSEVRAHPHGLLTLSP